MEEQEQKLSERLTLKLLSRSFVFRILIIDMLALSLSVCIHTHARAHTHTYIYIYNRNHKLSFEENLTNSCCHRCSRVCWGFFKSEDCCSGAYSTCLLLVLKCACSPTCCFWRWYILELLDFWPSQSSAQYQFSAVLRGWQFVTSAWNQIQLFDSIPRCSVGFGWSQKLENAAVILEKTHLFILNEISPESLTVFPTVGNTPGWMWFLKWRQSHFPQWFATAWVSEL